MAATALGSKQRLYANRLLFKNTKIKTFSSPQMMRLTSLLELNHLVVMSTGGAGEESALVSVNYSGSNKGFGKSWANRLPLPLRPCVWLLLPPDTAS